MIVKNKIVKLIRYLTQCAAVKMTRGWINEPPHRKTFSVLIPVSSFISVFRIAAIHGN